MNHTPVFLRFYLNLLLLLTGGIFGAVFTHKDHRDHNLFWSTSSEMSSRAVQRDEVVLGESPKSMPFMEKCGFSHGIVLHEPEGSQATAKL